MTAIARAFYDSYEVLIFDEPSSALIPLSRGYRNTENLITIIYLFYGKLRFDLPMAFG